MLVGYKRAQCKKVLVINRKGGQVNQPLLLQWRLFMRIKT